MSTWNGQSLVQWVEANRPASSEAVISLLLSLERSSQILDYHYKLARDAFSDYEGEDGYYQDMFAAMASFDPDFELKVLTQEANIIASIHTVRNYADIFAQIVNLLAMADPMDVHRCDFGKVASSIPDSTLKQSMLSLNCSNEFRHIAAFSNISKHRRLLKVTRKATFSKESGGELGLEVEGFSFKFKDESVTFPQCWGHHLLEEAYTVYRRILGLGAELNSQLIHQ